MGLPVLSWRSRWPSAAFCAAALLASVAPGARPAPAAAIEKEPDRIDLVRDLPAAGDLAAPANGQTLYILDEAGGGVVAVDPFEPTTRWTAIAAEGRADGDASPVAIGCVDTSTVALLCRKKDSWSLQTHRVQPGTTSDLRKPAQTVPIPAAVGNAAAAAADAGGSPERACLTVSPSRDWLAVCGLPAPLPAVMRAPIAGARIGAVAPRDCPNLPPSERISAATISTGEELVLFGRDPRGRPTPAIFVAFYMPPDPRRLLDLDTTLPRVRDAAFCRADGTLWIVGGEGTGSAATREGLWRIDAVLRNGRQAARAVCVARLDGARAVVCLSERAIIVTHGRDSRIVSRIDPTRIDSGTTASDGPNNTASPRNTP